MIKMGVDKWILAKIPGDDISAGDKLLTQAGPRQPPRLSDVVDAPNFGKVRITPRLKSSPEGRQASVSGPTATLRGVSSEPTA